MITLYGNPNSTCTRKVLTTLHEKGAEYAFRVIDLTKGEQKSPEHLARQPFGVIPVLDHDGFVLYESRAICRYLDRALDGTPLVPTDPRALGRMEQFVSVEQSYFSGPSLALLTQKIKNPRLGLSTDPAIVDQSRAKLAQAGDVIARWLDENRYFAGETFSLADVAYMPYVALLHATKDEDVIASRRSLARWWADVSSRPSWKKTTSLAPT